MSTKLRATLRREAQAINERNRVPGDKYYKEPAKSMKQDSTQIQEPEKKHTRLPWHVYEGGNFIKIGAEGYDEYTEREHYLGGPFSVAEMEYNATVNHQSDQDKALANAELIVRCVNSHDALIEALEAIAPRCDFVANRDTGGTCGAIAIAAGSFGLNYCREHKGDREPVEVGLKVESALAAAKE